MEYELCIREAEAQDAAALVAFLDLVGQETDFTSLDENGILMTESEMAIFIEKQATSDNQITLLALLNDEIAGVLNITAEQRIRIRHIGDIFLVIQRKFWNHGLGSILLEEGISASFAAQCTKAQRGSYPPLFKIWICYRRLTRKRSLFKRRDIFRRLPDG